MHSLMGCMCARSCLDDWYQRRPFLFRAVCNALFRFSSYRPYHSMSVPQLIGNYIMASGRLWEMMLPQFVAILRFGPNRLESIRIGERVLIELGLLVQMGLHSNGSAR